MKPAYFHKAQQLSRLAVYTSNAFVWKEAMQILRRALKP